jgi:hypothetical protein
MMGNDIIKLARDCGFTAFAAKGAEFKLTRFFHEAQRLKVEEIRVAGSNPKCMYYDTAPVFRLPEANDRENKA